MKKRYVLKVYVRLPYNIDYSRYERYVLKAMSIVGLDTYPDDVELGEKTIVLVYRDRKALDVLSRVKHHRMCRRRTIIWSMNTYICFDDEGEVFWSLNVVDPRNTSGGSRWRRDTKSYRRTLRKR